jgi:Ca2+-binding RTX toxin-like protein
MVGCPTLSSVRAEGDARGVARTGAGIYVANADGTAIRRLSNDCRVVGTAGPDALHGSFSQIVLGLGGSDRLYADDPGTFFEGDTLNGGPGNDALIGGYARDTLIGGSRTTPSAAVPPQTSWSAAQDTTTSTARVEET